MGGTMKVKTLIKILQKLKNQEADIFYEEDQYPVPMARVIITKNYTTPEGTFRGRDKEYYMSFSNEYYASQLRRR